MKWIPLLWAALRRKPGRTIFTLLSIMVAFVLVGSMTGLNAAFQQRFEEARADRISIYSRFGAWFPLSHFDQIAHIDGIAHMGFNARIEATYQEPENFILIFNTDPRWGDVRPDWGITPEDYAKLESVQDGFLATDVMAERMGWSVGDLIPFQTDRVYQDGSRNWSYRLAGTVPAGEQFREDFGVGNFAFFNEGRADDRYNDIHEINVLVENPDEAAAIADEIEALFINTANGVSAETERARFENGIQGFVDARFFTFAISGAALFMLLFLTGNVMAQSIRERIPEFAVMKTIGFSDKGVFALVIGEAAILCLLGAGLGLLLANAMPTLVELILPNLPLPVITLGVVAISFGCAVFVAVVSGLPPAWRVTRLSIAEALGGR